MRWASHHTAGTRRSVHRLLVAVLVTACQDPTGGVPLPDVPALQSPSAHVVPPGPPELPPRERPVVAPAPRRPAMVRQVVTDPNPGTDTGPAPVDERPDEAPKEDDGTMAPTDEAAEWVRQASLVSPGCLLEGDKPNLNLPSPAALEHILRAQPDGFDGVAREALACLLDLPSLTGADVYGKTAFRPWVLHAMVPMAGGKREQGVFVTPIVTTAPDGEGTLYAVMDEREGQWSLRAARYIPWTGDRGSRKLVSMRPVRLRSRTRRALRVTQKDASHTTLHYIELTSTQRLMEVFRVTTHDKATGRRSKVALRGRGTPKRIAIRTSFPGAEGAPGRFEIEEYTATRTEPYKRTRFIEGDLDLAGAQQLADAKLYDDADWLIESLPKTVQRSAPVFVFRAKVNAIRKRPKTAMRYWKRATKAKGAEPWVHREYGRYLASRKRRRSATKALRKYLKLAPEAEDIDAVQAEIDALSR